MPGNVRKAHRDALRCAFGVAPAAAVASKVIQELLLLSERLCNAPELDGLHLHLLLQPRRLRSAAVTRATLVPRRSLCQPPAAGDCGLERCIGGAQRGELLFELLDVPLCGTGCSQVLAQLRNLFLGAPMRCDLLPSRINVSSNPIPCAVTAKWH